MKSHKNKCNDFEVKLLLSTPVYFIVLNRTQSKVNLGVWTPASR